MNTNETNDTKNFEGKYRVLKREFQKLDQLLTTNRVIKYCFIVLTIFLLVSTCVLFNKNQNLISENIYLHEENVELASELDLYFDTALYFADASVAMDDTNANLKAVISEQEEQLMAYREREELYEAFEWALYDKSGRKTDITYGQIQSLQEYCDTKGYSTEMVDLVLAVAMKESTGNEKAYNASSGASGYCQLLGSTARMVYTKLQDNEEPYTHDVALDGEKNLCMASDYLQYLYEYHGNDPIKMIDSYRGQHIESYINTIDNYLKKNDLSIYNLDLTREE